MATTRTSSRLQPTTPERGSDLLWRYTRDHWAAAAGGVALARRMWHNNLETPWANQLERVYHEVRSDEATLTDIRQRLGHPGGRVRRLAALGAERAARLKLNGRLVSYSPLSRVIEAETLLAGVRAKRLLWSALHDAVGPVVAGVEIGPLLIRADSQLATLTELHRWAVTEAFQPRPDTDRPDTGGPHPGGSDSRGVA